MIQKHKKQQEGKKAGAKKLTAHTLKTKETPLAKRLFLTHFGSVTGSATITDFLVTANLNTESELNGIEGFIVVYCSKCGTQNPDDAKVCSKCGAPLYTVGQNYPGSEREHYRRVEGECFGLPNGGMIAGLVFGVIIIIVGFGFFLQETGYISNFWSVFWPVIIVIFGILIVAGAIFGQRRRTQTRRY